VLKERVNVVEGECTRTLYSNCCVLFSSVCKR
jgi:hypothetical protein